MLEDGNAARRAGGRLSPCSIVIPVYNRASLTRQCLDLLLTGPQPAVEYEVVVVDDGSSDLTPRLLERYGPFVRVVQRAANAGFARAANSGAAAAAGDYLVFLNNDTLPEPGWLDALVRYADDHPEAAVVGSKLLYPNETIQHAGVTITVERIPRHIYRGFPRDHPVTNKSRRFQAVTAACALMRRDAFELAGGFDENFTNGYEDIDLCLRLSEGGREVHYCHESVVVHLENATRGFHRASPNHDLFLKRWPHLVPDDLQYYIADGLLGIAYREQFPIELHVSPLLATVASDDSEADRLLGVRSRQVFELLQENTRLRTATDGEEREVHPPYAPLPDPRAQRAVLFASGGPGDSARYRSDHQAEQLAALGVTSSVATAPAVAFGELLDRYEVFVLHRVPYSREIEWFIREAKVRGKVVIFDTDDLVFEPQAMRHIAALHDMSEPERVSYREGVERYRDTVKACDAILVTTEPLRDLAADLHPRVVVVPNVVSREMVELANASLAAETGGGSSGQVTIGYLSGTRTHDADFLEAADALLACLERYPSLRVLIIGLLTLDQRFERFRDRIDRLPIQRWQRLPALLRRMDVSIAPLERNNPFTESKSCVKYLEAGLVAVPVVASARADFVRVIEHGRNGLLADSPQEWEEALTRLVDSPELREEMGQAARDDVLAQHTSSAGAARLVETFRALSPNRLGDRPLIVNWVISAPISQASGGYRNIFELASRLAAKEHLVRVYVEPIAHLDGLSDDEVKTFVTDHYAAHELELHVNRSSVERPDFLPADVSIATFWSTAASVANHERSLLKAYFVQDYEPDFYAADEPYAVRARESYDLPLRHICLGTSLARRIGGVTGKPADAIDFALEDEFELTVKPEDRPHPLRVLFFARPSMKRRAYPLGVEALALLKARHPDVEIAFFGSRDEELGEVPFAFRNLGMLSGEELAAAMNRSHILLTFSLTNISNVPFEGMACGCAVVEAKTPENDVMLADGENTLLAEPAAEAVADALERLVLDRELRLRLANRGVADMQGRSWERTAAQFESVLRDGCFTRLSVRATSDWTAALT